MPDDTNLILLPDIHVQVGLASNAVIDQLDSFILDDATFGVLDSGTLGLSSNWTDITDYVRAFSINRQSTREQGPLWTFQAGTCSIKLDNSTGDFDPDNGNSVFASGGENQITPMTPVRIYASMNGVDYPLYLGYIDGCHPDTITYQGDFATATLSATDAFKVLSGKILPAISIEGIGDDTGARVTDILQRVGWYTSAEWADIDTGNSTMQGTTLGADALQLIQLAVASEIGRFFVDGDGAITFKSRHSLLTDTRSNAVHATFGDTPGTDHGQHVGLYPRLVDMGQADIPSAAAEWQLITGRPVTAVRVYFALSDFPASMTSDLTWMAVNGVKACITLRPAYNPVSSADLAAMETFLSACKNAGLQADIALWHEPYYEGLTSTQFIDMMQYYGPTVRRYYPLVFCTAVSSVANNSENSYYPGDDWVDKVATDYYGYQYLSGAGAMRLDEAASIADAANPPKPFGVWEFNAAELDLFNFLTGDSTDFEGGIASWQQTGNATVAHSTAEAHGGTGSLKLTATAAGTMSATSSGATSAMMPVAVGDTATCTAWFKAATHATTINTGVEFFDSSFSGLGTTWGSTGVDNTSGWTQSPETVAVAPAGAVWARARTFVQGVSVGEVHYVDDVVLSQGMPQADVTDFYTYIQSFMTARANAGKSNADILLYNGGAADSVLTNVITDSGDYRAPLYNAMYDALDTGATKIELDCSSISRASDDTTLVNDVQATRVGGTLQQVTDDASVAKYFFARSFERSDLILESDSETLSWAQWVSYIGSSAETRIESITIDPQANSDILWPYVLDAQFGDRIQVWVRPPGLTEPVTRDCFITGLQIDFDAKTYEWTSTWTFQDASKYGSFLTLDNPNSGKLDSNALAF